MLVLWTDDDDQDQDAGHLAGIAAAAGAFLVWFLLLVTFAQEITR